MPSDTTIAGLMAHLYASGPLTASAERKTRLLLLDTLACIAAGLQAREVRASADAFARIAPGNFRWPGCEAGLAASDAAFIGGLAACWDEACEGLARSHGRPGIPAIAASLPIAVARGASLGELLRAVVTGYEVGGRLGEVLRIRPGMHVDATWSCMAAAAAVARVCGSDAAQTVSAIDLAACQMPASLYLPITRGMNGRNTYLGHSARTGIDCAVAIAAGMGAPDGALDALHYVVLGGNGAMPPLAPAALSLIEEGYFKPYAAVRHVHYGVRAALDLREQLGNRLAAVESLRLSIYKEALTYCGIRAPRTAIQAQFSLSFGLAAALVIGDLGPQAYLRLDDPLIRALEARVVLVEDADRTQANRRGATLEARVGGMALTATVDAVEGDPGLPMSEAAVQDKFLRYAGAALGTKRAGKLMLAILDASLVSPAAALFDGLA